ncbi:uncharacterized protein BKA55DRAFT_538855 [Fusarium redolens]|uniref:Uncharacterized protein n=1 Tax=Fusarium redolens TaxID=48865 RepID=A0A9P9HAE0_FUSRE|nr:uncharacterized protein BKA55DRAFT_538855 [Fusarium redolens]KAH7254005.1 hypothetical protein BKA55DRAFT_538855 [Fusarium redolens]
MGFNQALKAGLLQSLGSGWRVGLSTGNPTRTSVRVEVKPSHHRHHRYNGWDPMVMPLITTHLNIGEAGAETGFLPKTKMLCQLKRVEAMLASSECSNEIRSSAWKVKKKKQNMLINIMNGDTYMQLLHGSKTSAPALSLFGSDCSGVHMGTRFTFQRSAAPSKSVSETLSF